jgi:pimeloyl-ACP methyl ester carboxylesterase
MTPSEVTRAPGRGHRLPARGVNATGCDHTASGRCNTATAATAPPTASTLAGVSYATIDVGDARYAVGVAGAVLLLHGFPQDHTCWQWVTPALARVHAVVVCDLKACGASTAPPGGPHGESYSAREIGAEFIHVMARLGHERFAVIGHDRGARVAYRMALDHPETVDRLCVLTIVPTVEQFDRLDAETALEYWPFLLLAQPAPLAGKLIAAAAEHVVHHLLASWSATPDAIEAQAVGRYVRAFTPATIAAWSPTTAPPSTSTARSTPPTARPDAASPARCSSTGAPRRTPRPTARSRSGGGRPATSIAARCPAAASSPKKPATNLLHRCTASFSLPQRKPVPRTCRRIHGPPRDE